MIVEFERVRVLDTSVLHLWVAWVVQLGRNDLQARSEWFLGFEDMTAAYASAVHVTSFNKLG